MTNFVVSFLQAPQVVDIVVDTLPENKKKKDFIIKIIFKNCIKI